MLGAMRQPAKVIESHATPTQELKTTLRVCLVTTEFHGLFKNGGIGTANTGLALALAQAGFDVTVAFANADETNRPVSENNFLKVTQHYRELGITMEFVPASRQISKPFDDPRSASYCVYLYLKKRQFDVVYFNDCGGHGFYSLLAKRTGVFQNAPSMYVVAHGPHEWVLELNSLHYWDRNPVIIAYMERRSAEFADALISPSQYLVDWMKSRNWLLPPAVSVIQNIVPLPDSLSSMAPRGRTPGGTTELVFFGRLEIRKGLELFCDAIDLLQRTNDITGLRITFLGKFSQVAGLHSGIYLIERARDWGSHVRILCTYAQEEALAYLNRPGVLAVIPSLAENSPCVVAECLQLGLPFLATGSGGTAELVDHRDREACLFAPNKHALAAKLNHILGSSQQRMRPSVAKPEIVSQWIELTSRRQTAEVREVIPLGKTGLPGDHPNSGDRPLVSVCLTLSRPSSSANALLHSLRQQDYPQLEILLLHAESGDGLAAAARAALDPPREGLTLELLKEPHTDRATARNTAAEKATGKYLLFVDEQSVILRAGCIDVLVSGTLRMNADVVTAIPLQHRQRSEPIAEDDGRLGYFPIGACCEIGALENCFGGGAILIDRLAFIKCGGFDEGVDPGIEDWLFLTRAVLSGLHLEVLPEPAFWLMIRPALELNRSRVLDNHRCILDAYSLQEVGLFRHVIEMLLKVERTQEDRLQEALAYVGSEAREIALRISSSFEPNRPEALRGFIQFCVARHKIEEAIDCALHKGRSLRADAIDSAKASAESIAIDTIRRPAQDIVHQLDLTADVRLRIKVASSLPLEDFTSPPAFIAAHRIGSGEVTVLKAPAVCPPGTISLRAVASLDLPVPRQVFVAIVASTAAARLHISEEGIAWTGDFWWSGWVESGELEENLVVSIPGFEPTHHLLDVHLLCKGNERDSVVDGTVRWESVSAIISVNNTITASVVESDPLITAVPREVIEQGSLLTDRSDFPFPVFVPGSQILVHPLPERVVLVRIPNALPRGAKAVRSVVSVERAEAHPVEFAVWIRPSAMPVERDTDFLPEDPFSRWFPVRDKFRRHSFTVRLPKPSEEQMDIYLATRVVEFPDVHFCHAVWHELLVME